MQEPAPSKIKKGKNRHVVSDSSSSQSQQIQRLFLKVENKRLNCFRGRKAPGVDVTAVSVKCPGPVGP